MEDLISGQDAVFMMEALKEAEAAAERGDYGIGAVVAGDPVSTQDYKTSVPPIFQTDKRQIVEFGGDLGVRCLEVFANSRVAIDAKLGYPAQN